MSALAEEVPASAYGGTGVILLPCCGGRWRGQLVAISLALCCLLMQFIAYSSGGLVGGLLRGVLGNLLK